MLAAALGIMRHTVTVWTVRKEIVWKYANSGIKCCAKNSGSDDDRGPFGHGYSIGSICSKLESVWGIKNDAVEQTAKKEENVLSIGIQRFVNTVNVLAIGRLPSIREYMKALANYAEGNILNRLEAGEDAKGMQMELEIMLDVANKGISTKTGDRIFDERYAAAVAQLRKVLKSEF